MSAQYIITVNWNIQDAVGFDGMADYNLRRSLIASAVNNCANECKKHGLTVYALMKDTGVLAVDGPEDLIESAKKLPSVKKIEKNNTLKGTNNGTD